MNPHIFREYDIRGIVDRDLTEETVESIGRAFGTLVRRETDGDRVVVGQDCRLSSPRLAACLIRGLCSAGVRVTHIGMVPTPVLYFTAAETSSHGAIMLTGSHNPPDYNGIKMMLGGAAVYGPQIARIRELIETQDFAAGEGSKSVDSDAISRYVDWVHEHAQMGARKVKIVVDGGNGVGGPTALPLLERLGIEVVPMFCDPDGNFPNHHPDPTVAENLESLKERVLAENADFGIGFDGDADRIGVVDERGETMWGDKLMIVFSRDILSENPGATVVGEVKCSQTLFDDIEAHGGQALMWKVGHSLIKAKMKELSALLAGEMSGHIFFKHRFFGFDDAVYAATRLAEIVSRGDRPLSSYLDGVPETFVTPEIRLDMASDQVKFDAARKVAAWFQEEKLEGVRDVVTIDGVRVNFEDGWGLVRASNTQPCLVLRAEATTPERRDEIEALLKERVQWAAQT